MPSDTHGRAIRNLLLVIVFQLGVGLLFLAQIANATRGFSAPSATVGQLVGGLTALIALAVLYMLEKSPLGSAAD